MKGIFIAHLKVISIVTCLYVTIYGYYAVDVIFFCFSIEGDTKGIVEARFKPISTLSFLWLKKKGI